MRKTVCFFLMCLFTITLSWSQEKKEATAKPAEKTLNMIMNKEVKPVPEAFKMGFESINGKDGMAYLKFLSSDALEGRETATSGYQVAAEFVATLLASWGLNPGGDMPDPAEQRRSSMMGENKKPVSVSRSFLQTVALKESVEGNGSAKAEWSQAGFRKEITFTKDVDYQYSSRHVNAVSLSAPVVFVGYGVSETSLKFDEYKDIDVKGKIVLMLSELPNKGDKDSPFTKPEIKAKYEAPMGHARRGGSGKAKLAMEKGAVAVLMVENSPNENRDVAYNVLSSQKIYDEKPILPVVRRSLSLLESTGKMPWETIPTLRISRQMADQILEMAGQPNIETLKQKIESTKKPNSYLISNLTFTVKQEITNTLTQSPNVLAYIEGSDPALKDEIIVMGAHMDHLGKRGDYVFNVADDNGSGSALILEVAQAFALNPVKPKRTVVFALWVGEEEGLLGSRFYIAHPTFPLAKTKAYINFDMVSRLMNKQILQRMAGFFNITIPEEELAKMDYEKIITFSYSEKANDVLKAFQESNPYVGMTLLLRESKGNSMAEGGSDHASFSMNKVAWGSFFGAMTEDYHQTTDTIDKVNANLMQMTSRLAFLAIMSLANQ